MSAWAEAAWVIDEINNSMNLNNRVFEIEHRLYVFALPEIPWDQLQEGDVWRPAGTEWENYDFSADSVWFVLQGTDPNEKVVGFSLYSTTNGWSQSIPFDIDLSTFNASQINFEFDDTVINEKYQEQADRAEWNSISNVASALNKILQHLGESSFTGNVASETEAGIVKIGTNINVTSDGTISVPSATNTTEGVVTVVQSIPATNASTSAVPSLNAVRAAINSSSPQMTTISIPSDGFTGAGQTFNGKSLYMRQLSVPSGLGECPTVFLYKSSGIPNVNEQKAFNSIRFITYDTTTNNNNLTVYSLTNTLPSSVTIGIKS